jgi:hypothetical protein
MDPERRDQVLQQIQRNGYSLKGIDPAYCADLEVVMSTVAHQGLALEFASAELRADKTVVWSAVSSAGLALEWASADLRADVEVVMCAVSNEGSALKYAEGDTRSNWNIVLRAVSECPDMLRFASAELQADRAAVTVAVSQQASCIRFASQRWRDDPDMMRFAVYNESMMDVTLWYASDTWRGQKPFVLECIGRNWLNWRYVAPALTADRDVVLATFASARAHQQQLFAVADNMDPSLRADKQVMLAAVDCVAVSLTLASPELQRDPDIVRTALVTGRRIDDATYISCTQMEELLAAVPPEFRNGADYDACVQRVPQLAEQEARSCRGEESCLLRITPHRSCRRGS